MPKFLIGLFFGKANRSSESYEELVKKYISILVAALIKNVTGFSENQLDKYMLPHPPLIRVTLPEMMHSTIYHAGYQQKQVMRNLSRLTTVFKTE